MAIIMEHGDMHASLKVKKKIISWLNLMTMKEKSCTSVSSANLPIWDAYSMSMKPKWSDGTALLNMLTLRSRIKE